MKIYGHDKAKLMAAGKPATLAFPSGHNHVLLPSGQHLNPNRSHETKKDRVRRRKMQREQQEKLAASGFRPVNFPMVPMPAQQPPDPVHHDGTTGTKS